jgi:hypothetical protein
VPASAPQRVSLQQNYPNPFNPSTTIRFEIPMGMSGRTTLRVFNVLGREIATLVDGTLQAGTHRVVFDAERLPAGVYYCRLLTGSVSETKKLLLLK